MEDVKRILAVSRMTKTCQKTVHYGVALSRAFGAELFVLHVIDTFWLKGWNVPMVSVEEEYRRELERTKQELDAIIDLEIKRGMAIREFVKTGETAEEVLKLIKGEEIDLVVLPAHEEGRLEHFLFGRSNEAIVRVMPCSVLLVKDPPEPATPDTRERA